MASYLPHHQAPRVWQSEMQKPGPAKRVGVGRVSSGSGRNFGPNWKPPVSFSRSGAIAQQATGQYGNYLLYRDQVNFANQHLADQQAKEDGQALNQAAGTAIQSMLGGVAKQGRGRGGLGPPSTGSPKSVGPSSPQQKQTAKVTPTATPQENAQAWGGVPSWSSKVDQFGTNMVARQAKPEEPTVPMQLPASQRGFKRPGVAGPGLRGPVLEPGVSGIVGGDKYEQLSMFGRQGYQPDVAPGPTAPRTETQRHDARVARQRRAGGNFGNINYNT